MRPDPPPGPSFVRFEPPDISFWAFIGDIAEPEMRRLLQEQIAYLAGAKYTLMLVDMSRTGSVAPGARKAGAENPPVPVFGTAIFGASFAIRAIATLVTTAGTLFTKATESPVRFFEKEDAARAWLAERRAVALSKM
jgi:hypothetical protein